VQLVLDLDRRAGIAMQIICHGTEYIEECLCSIGTIHVMNKSVKKKKVVIV